MGFKEIEVGFPAASQPDFDFIRQIIEEDRIPDDVAIQVLVQCRPELIERTYEAIAGARHAIVHFYNSTSTLQRRVVFGLDRGGIVDIATSAARLVRKYEETVPETLVTYEYSPESFTGTEPDFAVEICAAVMDVIEPAPDRKHDHQPAQHGRDVRAQHLRRRHRVVRPAHPRSGTRSSSASTPTTTGAPQSPPPSWPSWPARTGSRAPCSATASAPATWTWSPWRSTCSPRASTRKLDMHDIDALRRVAEYCNRLPVHPRHPYAGDLVYTAFSGSHQDAIKKGMDALPDDYATWEVPYLPIDPKHVGRTYEAIIRVNSQSGKGGVAYLMDAEHGLDLPRALQIEFSKQVQAVTEASGTEIKPGELWDVFARTYLPDDAGIRLISSEVSSAGKRDDRGRPRSSWTASTGRCPARATARWPPSSTDSGPSWASRSPSRTTTSTP